MKNAKTAVLMLNLGGPNNLSEVSPFLERFFSDSTVIRIPFGLGPQIGKLRGPAKVTKQYEKIGGGSPLLSWTKKQGEAMIQHLDKLSQNTAPHVFYPAFRYGLPLQEQALKQCIEENQELQNLILFSQYPQFSCTTGGNSLRELIKEIRQYPKIKNNIKVKVIDRWYYHQGYIKSIAQLIDKDLKNHFPGQDESEVLILFSAHSLPIDFVQEGDTYPHEISSTANLVMNELKRKNPFRIIWQSRVGFKQWLQPAVEHSLQQFSKQGFKNVLLVPLGFTSDHLETLYELDLEYVQHAIEKKLFKKIVRAQSLNADPQFTEALADIVLQNLKTGEFTSPNLKMLCPSCKFPNQCCQIREFVFPTQYKL